MSSNSSNWEGMRLLGIPGEEGPSLGPPSALSVDRPGEVAELAERSGLEIRPPHPGDFAAIQRIARASFPVPGWLFSYPENLAHYRPGWVDGGPDGSRQIAVAIDGRGAPVAYAYFAIGSGGDAYLKELAAIPRSGEGRVPRSGTCLLGHVLEQALRNGPSGIISLTVVEPHRARPARRGGLASWRDPVSYYLRFGFWIEAGPCRVALLDSPAFPEDTAMRAEIAVAHRAVVADLRCHWTARQVALGATRSS
jgi:hypothetical protein